MKILYIAEDLFNSTVHGNLCNSVARQSNIHVCGYEVDRYVHNRYRKLIAKNTCTITYDLPDSIKMRYKWDFIFKIDTKLQYLSDHANIADFNLIHASTLFSDGAVAYRIHKLYGIPYIVGVRGTDINLYLKYFIHLWPLAKRILSHASKVVFISESLKQNFNQSIFRRLYYRYKKPNEVVIPNGISNVLLDDMDFASLKSKHSVLYVGRFNKNKNVELLMKAMERLKLQYPDLHLTLVGGKGDRHDAIINKIIANPHLFTYLGEIKDKSYLKTIFRQHSIFAMVSHSETFGLVYIEALTQGLKLLITRNQGIDGMFENPCIEAVDSHSLDSIIAGLKKLLDSDKPFSMDKLDLKSFSWEKIANNYIQIYTDIITNN